MSGPPIPLKAQPANCSPQQPGRKVNKQEFNNEGGGGCSTCILHWKQAAASAAAEGNCSFNEHQKFLIKWILWKLRTTWGKKNHNHWSAKSFLPALKKRGKRFKMTNNLKDFQKSALSAILPDSPETFCQWSHLDKNSGNKTPWTHPHAAASKAAMLTASAGKPFLKACGCFFLPLILLLRFFKSSLMSKDKQTTNSQVASILD